MITKQRVVLHCARVNIQEATFCEEIENDIRRRLSVKARDWIEMGSPEVITVTIEPGDLLNDDPISR